MRAFLDIDIGDPKVYADDLSAFNLTTEFYKQVGPQVCKLQVCNAQKHNDRHLHDLINILWNFCVQYALSTPLADLDPESKEILREAFQADPTWSGKVRPLHLVLQTLHL
jgi:hypothetical protein